MGVHNGSVKRVLGVNGIHNWSWSDDSFTDKLLKELGPHCDTVDIKYRRMWALLAYFKPAIERRAEKILAENKPGDCVVAHSFGCLAVIYAMMLGAKFDKVFFFAAAVDNDMYIPEDSYNKLYNIHSPSDNVLVLGSLLPFHDFGTMGRSGYKGSSSKVENIEVKGYDHNDYVEEDNILQWVGFILEQIYEE